MEVLKEAGLTVLLPLMVLARGGKHRNIVEDAITTIQTVEGEDARDLLSLTCVFASLAFAKEADRHWLKRRFSMFEDALKNSWAYQEIWQGGKLEGKQEGLQEGLQVQRQTVEYIVETKFPALVGMAKERGNAIDRLEVLRDMGFKLFKAETEEEARRILSQ
ncbi:MAG: hypothetical protein ACYDER_08305 [Ktedonobacteraceae bacterium]